MSYYTTYEITIEKIDPETFMPTWDKTRLMTPDNSEVPADLVEKIHDLCGEDLEFDHINAFYGCAKWYEWQKDLTTLSKEYPEFMFTVDGSGEDCPDFWICWIVNGKAQYEQKALTHAPFDPEKLQ